MKLHVGTDNQRPFVCGMQLSRFLKASESRLVRFVRDDRNERARWHLVGSLSDRELAEKGALLAGPELDRYGLLEDGLSDALVPLLDAPKGADRDAQLAELLSACPRVNYLPPIDLDVAKGHTRAEALEWARRLEPALARAGLGVASWARTGGSAGVHGDLLAPALFAHVDLIEIARVLVLEAAREVGIPLLSDHPKLAGRPPIVLDDRLFRRSPDSRGLVWRLNGALKPGGGIKTSIDLDDREIDYVEPTRGDRAAFERAAQIVERQRELDAARYGKRPRGAARRQAKPPLELPAGTVLLDRFATTLARILAARTSANHEARLACAGWLIGTLGVSPAVVEPTLARATGNAEDARDAVSSTSDRILAGRPAKGLPSLQELLGVAAVVELRVALLEDGVKTAMKAYWTNPERQVLMSMYRHDEQAKGAKALRAGARCGTFAMPFECETHGAAGVRLNVEERELTCPHCRESRLAARLELMRETWTEPSYGVIVVRARADEPDRYKAVVAARRAAKAVAGWKPWRWFLGTDHAVLVYQAFRAATDHKFLAEVTSDRPDRRPREKLFEKKAIRAIDAHGITAADVRVATKEEVIELVSRAWRSTGLAFQGLVEAGDVQAALAAFPFLSKLSARRTGADKKLGLALYPWASKDELRARAKQRAIEARAGIDPGICDEAVDIDDFGCPVICGQPYHVHVDHLPTGVRLSRRPFIGVFPKKHDLETLLAVQDPEVLREGYELQRALARRR